MNGNRIKYTSTPTYGMQKRGFMKKPVSSRPVPQTPDFSKAPDPVTGIPMQPVPEMPAAFQPQPMPAVPHSGGFDPQAGQQPVQQASFAA